MGGPLFVTLNAIEMAAYLTVNPFWSFLIITLDIIIIYQLTVRWEHAAGLVELERLAVLGNQGLGDGGAHLRARLEAVVDRLEVDDDDRRHPVDDLAGPGRRS